MLSFSLLMHAMIGYYISLINKKIPLKKKSNTPKCVNMINLPDITTVSHAFLASMLKEQHYKAKHLIEWNSICKKPILK